MPLPTIDQLKHQHSIASVNTGRQFTIPSGRPGIVADDREKPLAMPDQEGLLVFRSGVEFPLWTFRGQTAIHAPCLPGIARCGGLPDQFDGGAALFPADAAASVAVVARGLTRFTMPQVTQAASAYQIWHGQRLDEADHRALIDAAGIEIIETSLLDWSAYDLETDEPPLHARLTRELAGVRTRWTF